MKTLNLTDTQYDMVVRAVEMMNDIENDTLFEDTTENLFPGADSPTVLTVDNASRLRNELASIMNREIERRSLITKLGIKVNEQGYTV